MANNIQTLSTWTPPSLTDPVLLRDMRDLFTRLNSQFGPKFNAAYGANPELAIEEWARGLAGFTGAEINRGLAVCRSRTFVPTLGEFALMCRPCLDPEIAWREAQAGLLARDRGEHGAWSHPAVWRAAMTMSYDLKNGTFARMRKHWEVALFNEFEKGWVEDVPPIPKRVEDRPTLVYMPAAVRKRLAEFDLKFRGLT